MTAYSLLSLIVARARDSARWVGDNTVMTRKELHARRIRQMRSGRVHPADRYATTFLLRPQERLVVELYSSSLF